MNKFMFMPLFCGALLMTGCGGEKAPDNQNDSMQTDAPSERVPYSDRERTATYETETGGHKYKIAIHQSPDKALPTVKDVLDQHFYDNRIDVTITRDGGEEIFSHSFTKEAFVGHLNKDDVGKFVLSAMGLDEGASAAGQIVLTAQVGEPGSEEPQHFRISIPTSGKGFSIEPGVVATMDIPMSEEE